MPRTPPAAEAAKSFQNEWVARIIPRSAGVNADDETASQAHGRRSALPASLEPLALCESEKNPTSAKRCQVCSNARVPPLGKRVREAVTTSETPASPLKRLRRESENETAGTTGMTPAVCTAPGARAGHAQEGSTAQQAESRAAMILAWLKTRENPVDAWGAQIVEFARRIDEQPSLEDRFERARCLWSRAHLLALKPEHQQALGRALESSRVILGNKVEDVEALLERFEQPGAQASTDSEPARSAEREFALLTLSRELRHLPPADCARLANRLIGDLPSLSPAPRGVLHNNLMCQLPHMLPGERLAVFQQLVLTAVRSAPAQDAAAVLSRTAEKISAVGAPFVMAALSYLLIQAQQLSLPASFKTHLLKTSLFHNAVPLRAWLGGDRQGARSTPKSMTEMIQAARELDPATAELAVPFLGAHLARCLKLDASGHPAMYAALMCIAANLPPPAAARALDALVKGVYARLYTQQPFDELAHLIQACGRLEPMHAASALQAIVRHMPARYPSDGSSPTIMVSEQASRLPGFVREKVMQSLADRFSSADVN